MGAETTAGSLRAQRRPSFTSLKGRMLLVLTNGKEHQSFLGNRMLPALIRALPRSWRRPFVLRLINISPHYFTEAHLPRYAGLARDAVLEKELERNIAGRRLLHAEVVRGFMQPDMTALDFGCGFGALASEMAKDCRSMIGVDLSCGALACGEVLFPLPNLTFARVSRGKMAAIGDASTDLVTAIAVMQHMDDEALASTLREFHRVLTPGGKALCHIPLWDSLAANPAAAPHANRRNRLSRLLQKRYGLLMLYRTEATISRMAEEAGFAVERADLIGQHSRIEDDIANQHLFVLRKQ
jgi:SAM-dependent methyltransferase